MATAVFIRSCIAIGCCYVDQIMLRRRAAVDLMLGMQRICNLLANDMQTAPACEWDRSSTGHSLAEQIDS